MARELDPRNDKAFAFAQESTKQLLTLSTAVLALTLTFLKDVADKSAPKWIISVGWIGYVLSIVFGILTLMALAGNMEGEGGDSSQPSIYAGNIRLLAGLQVLTFIGALGFTVWFGIKAI
jgi:hypothetical protein